MKSSLILTVFILVSAAFIAAWQKGEAGTLDEEYQTLRQEVVALGVDPASLSGEQASLSRMKLNQVLAKVDAIDTKTARDARTRAFAKEIAAFAAEMKERERKGPPDEATQARLMEIMESLLSLQGDDFKVMLEAFRQDPSLTGGTREELVGMAVMMLGRQSPQAALNLLTESKDELMKGGRTGFMVGMCLQGLAQQDPAAALAWVDAHPDLADEQARRQTMQGVAAKNPELAMKRLLSGKEGSGSILGVAAGMSTSANDAASRNNLLTSMRKAVAEVSAAAVSTPATASPEAGAANAPARTPKITDQLRDGLLTGIGSRLTESGFDEAKAWLESDALKPEEKSTVLNGVAGSLYGKDPSPWLDWMSSNLPADQFSGKLQILIPQWTNQDFNAVGAWINGQPAGKPKEEAILSFAETLIPHEPEAAERWLESLPESPRKQDLLNKLQPPAPAVPDPAVGAPAVDAASAEDAPAPAEAQPAGQ